MILKFKLELCFITHRQKSPPRRQSVRRWIYSELFSRIPTRAAVTVRMIQKGMEMGRMQQVQYFVRFGNSGYNIMWHAGPCQASSKFGISNTQILVYSCVYDLLLLSLGSEQLIRYIKVRCKKNVMPCTKLRCWKDGRWYRVLIHRHRYFCSKSTTRTQCHLHYCSDVHTDQC